MSHGINDIIPNEPYYKWMEASYKVLPPVHVCKSMVVELSDFQPVLEDCMLKFNDLNKGI